MRSLRPAQQSARVHLVPLVRLALAALCACASFACATPAVLERAGGSTTTDSRATTLRAVKRAATLESGALLLCVELRSFQRRQVSVEVPLQAIGKPRERTGFDFGREPGFDGPSPDDPSALRYVFNEDDFEPGCPEDEIDKPLPIYTSKRGSRGPGVYTSRVGRSLALHYVSAKPIWSSLRDLEIAPVLGNEEVEVEVPGKPIYYLALPFAFVLDTVFALFTLGLVF